MATKHFAVGLDAGGTKTFLLAQCNGCSDRIERRGPGANPQRTGLEASADTLATLVRDVVRPHRPVDALSVYAGVAGAGRDEDQEVLTEHLHKALTDETDVVRVQVVHDACIALDAAFGAGSGLVIIVGTGSVVFGRTRDGEPRRAGGWGHLLGDAGSGYAVWQAGLRAVAEAFDGGADTSLLARVRDRYGIDERETFIHWVYQGDVALQDVAPLVIEAANDDEDPVASDILTTQTARLAQQVEWLLDGDENIEPRIALLGGMLQNEYFARLLRRTLRDRLPEWTIERLRQEPAVGALHRARRLLT